MIAVTLETAKRQLFILPHSPTMLATRLTTARSLARLVPSGRRSLASGHGSHGTPAPIVNMPKAPSSMPAGYPRPPPASTDLGQTAWAVGGVLGVVGVGAALALGGGGDKHGHGDAKAAAHAAPAAAATAVHGVDYNAVAKGGVGVRAVTVAGCSLLIVLFRSYITFIATPR